MKKNYYQTPQMNEVDLCTEGLLCVSQSYHFGQAAGLYDLQVESMDDDMWY